MVAEEVAGHADLAAAGLEQHGFVEVGALLDRGFEPGGLGRWPGERNAHEPLQIRTPVLGELKAWLSRPLVLDPVQENERR